MRDVEIPKWLKGLPMAPEFRPTDTEFADPIAYISKIEKEASAFGICKVIPPLPKPSKKYVLHNLNKSLSKCPDFGPDVNLHSLSKVGVGDVENGRRSVFTTRQQELGQSGKKAKRQVWQSGEVYTLEQFEAKSRSFAKSQLGVVKEVSPLVVETMFWQAASESPIYVEYANDVPGSGFGEPDGSCQYLHRRRRRRKRGTFDRNARDRSGSNYDQVDNVDDSRINEELWERNKSNLGVAATSTSVPFVQSSKGGSFSRPEGTTDDSGEMEGSAGWKLSNSPWNLQVIARSRGSLTRFMPDDIPGVTSPMIYIGMLFSWFAWHVEDHELHSLNFLHTGSPKTWYAVPGDHAFDFEEVIRTQAYGGDIDHLASLSLLGEKTTLLSPEIFVELGIPCCRLVQNPGEFVVTFPRAYHVGFSHGFNCGEAANFGTPKWLTVAKEAAVRRAAMNFLPMLSHQQLLYLLTMSFISSVPRTLLPGVRSSRLRDRQKEERELLVKRAFIEDILTENSLLTVLLQRNCSYRTVLWDLELLPSSSKESEFCSTVTSGATALKENNSDCDNHQDLFTQMNLYMENVNGSFAEDDDITCEFQVDSGTLPCVACGILGFPFMAVVQPSEKAFIDVLLEDQSLIQDPVVKVEESEFPSHMKGKADGSAADKMAVHDKNLGHHHLNESSTRKVELGKGWNASRGFLRPRVFCLEHAIQTEELLSTKGGANVLAICHSDFLKVKAHASLVAEEIGHPFKYIEIPLDTAMGEDLNLIDLAIDNGEQDICGEDWTAKLSINLQHCVKVQKEFPSNKLQHGLALDSLLIDKIHGGPSMSMNWQWQSRRSRSRRHTNFQAKSKLPIDVDIDYKKEQGVTSDSPTTRKEVKLLQYSRRKYKHKRPGPVEVTEAPEDQKKLISLEVSPANCEYPVERTINTPRIALNVKGRTSLELDSLNSCNMPVLQPGANNPAFEALADNGALQELQDNNCNLILPDSQTQSETKVSDGISEGKGRCSFADSTGSPIISVQSTEHLGIMPDNQTVNENMNNSCSLVMTDDSGDIISKDVSGSPQIIEGADDSSPGRTDEQIDGTVAEQCTGGSKALSCATTNKSTPGFEVNLEAPRDMHVTNSSQDEDLSFSLHKERELAKSNSIITYKRSGSKRKREVPKEKEDQLDTGFIRSPCEGLRSRVRKDELRSRLDDKKCIEEEKTVKKVRKMSNSSVPSKDKTENKKGYYKCDIEGCRMKFQKKAELCLHKRNQCPVEGCRKRFNSHKYAVLHQRVHDDDRPLKCPWKGCTMSFKWAWARTEHLRVHTGERPYECKVGGCGLTFRFVSDFSRHRRKTGHHVN